MEPAVESPVYREAAERADMVCGESPEGLRVVQITSDNRFSNNHIYMESHVFTPDSRRFVFERLRNPEETHTRKMLRDYMLCDLDDACSFRQITDEHGAIAPSVSPDGKFMYYVIDATTVGGGFWAVRRVDLETFRRETVAKFDTPLKGTNRYLSRIYPLSSISSDGKRLCVSGFLGDGNTPNAPWGLIVFDIEKAAAELIFQGQSYTNMHPQYCRSKEPVAARDILVQHNHGCGSDAQGDFVALAGGRAGADVHVIRDDGTDFRSMPWGRDGVERCQGHQAWRGRMTSAVSSMSAMPADGSRPLIEAWAAEVTEENAHDGRNIPGARRNDLSRNISGAAFLPLRVGPDGDEVRLRSVVRPGRAGDRHDPRRTRRSPDDPLPDAPQIVLYQRADASAAVPVARRETGVLQLRRAGPAARLDG